MKKFFEKHQIQFPLFRDLWNLTKRLYKEFLEFAEENVRWEFRRLFERAKDNFGQAFSQLFDDVGSASHELFIQIPRDIKTFFKNLWAYKGLLWQDRHWDHAYILRLLQLKIRLTKEHIGECQRHTRWQLDVKNMQKAEDLLEILLDDDHGKELYEAHDAKWGKSKHIFIESGNGYSIMRTVRAKAHSPAEQEQERKEYSALTRKVMRLEEQNWSKLWKHLDKHMRSWWD